jgi:hypothetical protein
MTIKLSTSCLSTLLEMLLFIAHVHGFWIFNFSLLHDGIHWSPNMLMFNLIPFHILIKYLKTRILKRKSLGFHREITAWFVLAMC